MSDLAQTTCLLTGATGYLGGCIKHALHDRGWRVIELSRRQAREGEVIPFELGEDLPPSLLEGAKALVHCAYDFSPLSWQEIDRINVSGSRKLLTTARAAKVAELVYISSISAFDGCRSLYGRAKLATEAFAHSLGATVIRPGLILGHPAGAMFKSLCDQVDRGRVLPLVGGAQRQYLVHQHDLTRFITRCLEGFGAQSPGPITIAHEQSWTIGEILHEIAAESGKTVAMLPVPWRLVWAALKAAEISGMPTRFRSDSLVSLMYQNPQPSFSLQRELNVNCRPFRLRDRS